jgi:hypothetical protein
MIWRRRVASPLISYTSGIQRLMETAVGCIQVTRTVWVFLLKLEEADLEGIGMCVCKCILFVGRQGEILARNTTRRCL